VSVRTESGVFDATATPPAYAHSALDRIRRAAQLIAAGTLSGSQSRQFATEIERIADSLLQQKRSALPRADPRLNRLSVRERQVLAALAAGNSVQEIAHQFCRSPKTINNQRTSVLRKLELRNTAELTRFAILTGLVPLHGDYAELFGGSANVAKQGDRAHK
jgi:DNA-binding NarL/FixJ family response regulator